MRGRPSKTWADYQRLGLKRDLTFKGPLPTSIYIDTNWLCIHCGAEMVKAYRSVRVNPNGCRCQSGVTLQPDDYHRLADHYGITWTPGAKDYFPRSAKVKTWWSNVVRGETKRVYASYHQLCYHPVQYLLDALGLVLQKAPETRTSGQKTGQFA